MRQAIHIFCKDARHCRPYIAVVLALTAMSAWLAYRQVLPGAHNVEPLFLSLIPLAWWLTIGAAVQAESLAGDRQFWVTRPYSWKSLLAAKLLFAAAFIGLPVLLSDCLTLLANGFNPLTLIPGLLLRQAWLAGVLGLPFAVAALTRTIRDLVLAGLVFLIFFSLEGILAGLHLSRMATEPAWIRDGAPWLLPVAGLSLAVWQFARRRTTLIRVLALALAPWAPVWTLPSLARFTGPPVPGEARFRNIAVQFDPSRGHAFPGARGGWYYLPVTIAGWPNGLVACQPPGGGRFAKDSPGGLYCVTPGPGGGAWLVLYASPWLPAEGGLSLPMDLAVYEQQDSVTLPSDGGWVRIPGFGDVRVLEKRDWTVLIARTALKPAGPEWSFRLGGQTEDGWWHSLPSDTAPDFPTPLVFRTSGVCLKESGPYSRGSLQHPVLFTPRRLAAVLHRELKIAHIKLADYQGHKP